LSVSFPWTGILSSIAAALGVYGLYWYENLTKEDRAEADRLAVKYAKDIYGKGLSALTSAQLSQVQGLVKGHFAA
jgi:hypothetical protein